VATAIAMRNLVVYAAGGGMRAIFSAGALHALAELGARDRVLALYGISAGAFNIAQFALGATMRASKWYYHDVPAHGILARATPVAVLRGEDVMDVPVATRVLETEHLLDAEALARSPVPVSFGVVARGDLTFRWLDARRPDVIRVLIASSSLFPFVHEPAVIDGVPYIDGGYREVVCYARLRREHPDARLLLLLNDNEDESLLQRTMFGAMLRLRDAQIAAARHELNARAPAELAAALRDPHTLVVRPDDRFPVHFSTIDPSVLVDGFWRGYRTLMAREDSVRRLLAD